MIDDIADARRPSIQEFTIKTSAGTQVAFKQQHSPITIGLTGLRVIRTFRPKQDGTEIVIQADIEMLEGNLFTFKTGSPPEFTKIAEDGIMTLRSGAADELIFDVGEYPRLNGRIDKKTFDFMVGWIDAGKGSLTGDIELELESVHVDEVAPGEDHSYLIQANQEVKVLEVHSVSVSTAL